jgi:hypothetical protein
MQTLGKYETELSQKYMSYMAEVAHGERARKMEKRREDVINSIRVAIREGGKLRPFKGDASLRDAYKNYWNVLLSVFNEDYHKIVDMEEVAERSYDAMEAYLLTQEKASEKLSSEYDKVSDAYRAFAAKHNVQLREGQSSKLDKKLAQVGMVNKYLNEVYLVFFKSAVQESSMIEAMNKNDLNGLEQGKNSLLKFSTEGLVRLDTIKPFKGDASLTNGCRKVLEFHKAEAQNKIGIYAEFLMKKEEMEKVSKTFQSKPQSQRTQKDVETYNKATDEYNKMIAEFNKVNNELNTSREKVLNNWNISRKRFLDLHVPH